MTVYAVVFTPRAERQLDDIYAYIAEHGGEARAEGFVGRLIADCNALSMFPEIGSRRDDIRPGLRTKGYARRATIAFSVDVAASQVVIHGVFYGGQDFERQLRDDDGAD